MKTIPYKSISVTAAALVAMLAPALADPDPAQGLEAKDLELLQKLEPQVRVFEFGEEVSLEEAKRQMIKAIKDAGGDTGEKVGEKKDSPKPWRIGLMVEALDPVLRIHLNIPKEAGMMVSDVVAGGPAAKAGIEKGDIIVAAGDRKIGSLDALKAAVQQAGKVGKPLPLALLHEGRRKMVRVAPDGPKPPVVEKKVVRPLRDQPKAIGQVPKRPMFDEVMQIQKRRFEEMAKQMGEMRRMIAQQQKRIEALEKRASQSVPQIRVRRPSVLLPTRPQPKVPPTGQPRMVPPREKGAPSVVRPMRVVPGSIQRVRPNVKEVDLAEKKDADHGDHDHAEEDHAEKKDAGHGDHDHAEENSDPAPANGGH